MATFVFGYYAALIIASVILAYVDYKKWFLMVFSLLLVSFVAGIVGGAGALEVITIFVAVLATAAAVSYAFKFFLVLIAKPNLAKELKTAPLTAAFGMFVIFTYAVAGIFAPLIAPHGQAEVISGAFAPPDANMLLGADQLGRDIFSRIIYGARNTVGLALIATLGAFFLGALAGLLAAVKGGWFDQFMGRVADVIMSIPSLIFALLMLSILGTSTWVIVVVVAVIYSPRVFRLTRAVAGNIVVMDYIEAAKLRGEGDWYLIRREILPNSTAPLIAEFGLEFCFVFLLIAGLSFLGLGLQPPTADWGSMVRENATLISFGDITPLIPAAAIALLTVSVNFVVDWMLFRSSGLKEQ
ncbi:ABC transporter permease subunit [Maritimibacter sp. DP07]|jgi:peptide/nickel transport system permease protein|uniref:ABC transporter permease subunit n=1 Tax=Maritimibacter harenae TaxID=2606218 RepID=A0A845M7D7_9RHOB|nr:ABC transporter permease [Maritimibacter harenae]MZR15029.1 ABC transporter permease subunit [Maritimibacter harenae]